MAKNRAKWFDIHKCLNRNGAVRFVHCTGRAHLVWNDGTLQLIDGRSYQGFLTHVEQTKNPYVVRFETGSVEDKNLIIEWRLNWMTCHALPE